MDTALFVSGEGIMRVLLSGIFLFTTICASCHVTSSGNTHHSGLARESVQAAINSASDGDTVILPAGDVTWSSGITMPSHKTVKVEGQGIGQTIIRAARTGMDLFVLGLRGHTIGNFETEKGAIDFGDSQGFRIHHVKFYNDPGTTATYDAAYGRMDSNPDLHLHWGVIDNCEFFNCRVVSFGAAAMLAEDNTQHRLWTLDAPLGGQDVVYVEDCAFDYNSTCSAIDGNYGGRYVFRHNTVKNGYCEVHSVQGNNRALRTWEIYNNTFEGGEAYHWTAMFLRGGTGVAFDNVIENYITPIALNNVRDTEYRTVCGQCDGLSNWDQNTPGEGGWRCRDQIGSGKDAVLWAPGQPFQQESDPAYFWNNVDGGGNPISPAVHNPSNPNHIQQGRDYYLAQKPGYAPLTYPHPLRID